MRIGIMSMQRVPNCGSFLQAYGLKKTLESLGADSVSFIDFHNGVPVTGRKRNIAVRAYRWIMRRTLPKFRGYAGTEAADRKFRKRMREEYQPALFPPAFQEPSETEYDLVVFGSDEVFNIRQFTDYGAPIPWELLGEGVRAKRLVSYAASCGQTDPEFIGKTGETEHCRALLRRFSALSARDENTVRLLRELGPCVPETHIDPTLLVSGFPPDEGYRRLPDRYMIVYAYSRRINDPGMIRAIRDYAAKKGLKIVSVDCFQAWIENRIVASPFALLQYFADAECVVTDTYHGTAFSIRFNKPFATIIRKSNRNKISSLLKQFGLEDRELRDPGTLEAVMEWKIDYEAVNGRIEREREKGREYLRTQVGGMR